MGGCSNGVSGKLGIEQGKESGNGLVPRHLNVFHLQTVHVVVWGV